MNKTVSIPNLVDDFLDPNAPVGARRALIELIGAARKISTRNNVCGICLLTLAADVMECAVQEDKIGHDNESERAKRPPKPTAPSSGTVQ